MVAVAVTPRPLGRDMVEAVLRDLDPPELVTPLLRRVASSGFVTEDLLGRLVVRMQRHVLPIDDPLVLDLGCGAGGVGLWLAEQLRTRLVGIDRDHVAVRRARLRRAHFEMAYEPSFHRSSFDWTGLAPAVVDVIVSIDGLHHAADPASALAEAARVLAPGGVLCFDTYVDEQDRHGWRWIRLLLDAGFDVIELDDQTDPWRALLAAKHRARVQYAAYLMKRLGPTITADELSRSRRILGIDGRPYLQQTRRLEIVAIARR